MKDVFFIQTQQTFWKRAGLLSIALFVLGILVIPTIVLAAPRKGYEAKLVNSTFEYTLTPGEKKTVTLDFKNIGKETWKRKGSSYVSLYTTDEQYRKSIFESSNWFDATHAALLKETSVAKGKSGHFNLVLNAPKKKGTYTESFQLVAENVAWIPGGKITLKLTVKDPKQVSVKTSPVNNAKIVSSNSTNKKISAFLLLRSEKNVVAESGEEIVYKVGIKNTGTVAWKKREIRSNDLAIASLEKESTSTQLALNTEGEIVPGAIDFLSFVFNAPTIKGSYVMHYRFAANDELVQDLLIDIPVDVTADSSTLLESQLSVDQSQVQAINLIPEPILRIGILIVDDETQNQVKISCNTPWKLMDGNGSLLSEQPTGTSVTAFYKNQRYYFNRGQGLEQSSFYLRFVPETTEAICTIENFDQRLTRHAANADNQFRGIMELRYNSAKNRTWVINELGMEYYLHGLGETSEASPYEFKKTLIVTARTFALYQFERATKHASEFFHMNAYADDQVYKGYSYEMRNPSIGKAADETRGITVNYEGRTAITPYFSRSDGRTRDWHEVWGGTVAWAKSVPCPCDKENGRKLWGHGVGMSATEALCMADKQGKKWDEILKYFYTGIGLNKRWN